MALMLLAVAGFHRIAMASPSAVLTNREQHLVTSDLESTFSFPDAGTTLLLQPNSRVAVSRGGRFLRLVTGTVLLRATGFASTDLGFGAHATALMGSMLALRDDASATVIALTAPVLVTLSGHEWILPSGYQLKIDADGLAQRFHVPSDWFSEQTARSQSLPSTPLPPLPDAEKVLLNTDSATDDISSELQSLSDEERSLTLATVIDQPTAILSSSLLQRAFLLSASLSDPSRRHLFALHVVVDFDRLDPEAGDVAMKRIAEESFDSSEMAFAVPAIALSTLRPLPPSLIDRWAEDAIKSVVSNASLTASTIHSLVSDLPSVYESSGYPKQAELWQQAIDRIDAILLPLLPKEEREKVLDTALPIVTPSSSPENAVPAADLLPMSRAFLLEHAVLFTTLTDITADPIASDCARVSGVLLQEGNRDVPYEFSLCIAQHMVRRIKRDALALPNDVSFENFFH